MEDNIVTESNLLGIISEALLEAGNIALKFENQNLNLAYKSPSQPVTDADIEINNFLRLFFKKNTPTFGWLSEESDDDMSRFQCDYFWCVDPIDGTRSFINKKPEYTISVALIKKSKPIFGIIYNPRTKELFHAEKNKGAYCNRKKIFVSEKKELEEATLAISTSESKIFEKKNIKKKKLLKIGSIAYKIALVAKGTIDATVSITKKNDWDVAAADLILREAGGVTSELKGNEIVYNSVDLKVSSIISSNKILHNKIYRSINDR